MKEVRVLALLADDLETATFRIVNELVKNADAKESTFDIPEQGILAHVYWEPVKPANEDEWRDAIESVILLRSE